MKKAVLSMMAVLVIGGAAMARPQYQAQFYAVYLTPGSEYEATVKAAKCNLCHEGTKKSDRNAYGKSLAELLSKDDASNPEKIKSALETVGAKKSAGDDSPTFGELIKMGKLPAGE